MHGGIWAIDYRHAYNTRACMYRPYIHVPHHFNQTSSKENIVKLLSMAYKAIVSVMRLLESKVACYFQGGP